jgi:hypothetical protein
MDELRLAEYRILQRLAGLERALAQAQSDDAAAALVTQIAAARVDLQSVRDQMGSAPAPPLSHKDAPKDNALGPGTTGVGVTVTLRMAEVPTSVVHLLDAATAPLVSVKIEYRGTHWKRLRVTAFVDGYSAEAVGTTELVAVNAAPAEATIDLLPTFFPDRLRAVTEATRATLRVRVENLDAGVELDGTYPIWLLARTTARLAVRDPAKGSDVDLSRQLGAFVTPNAPAVLEVLRKAVDLHPDKALVGYQTDEAGVAAQVAAIYAALKAAQIAYVNTVRFHGALPDVWAQRIRLPSEALADRSANCMDGVMLMASLIEAASLSPALVLLPGHAIVAWRPEESADRWSYLETTLVSTDTFEAACTEGKRAIARAHAAAEAAPGSAPQVLAIDELRASGIAPME